MWWAVLGSLEVQIDSRPIGLGGAKQRRVLAALLAEAGSAVSVERLVDSVWGDDPPPSAVGTLRAYVANLRRALEPDRAPRKAARLLVSSPAGYRLDVPPERYDAARFAALTTSAGTFLTDGRPVEALAAVDRALGLWRGPAFGEFTAEPFAALEASRLEELRLVAQERRAEAQLAAGLAESAAAGLRPLVAAEPLRERRWLMLAVALYRCGRQAEAREALREVRRVLADGLGIEPGPGLRGIERAILGQDPLLELDRALRPAPPPDEERARTTAAQETRPGRPPVAASRPSPPTASALASRPSGHRPGRGPVTGRPRHTPDSGLEGRDDVLASVDRALTELSGGRGGLLLVTGEPGIGKTRVGAAALERAAARGLPAAVGRCPDDEGVPALWPWLTVLRSVADPDGTGHRTGARARISPERARTPGPATWSGAGGELSRSGEQARSGLKPYRDGPWHRAEGTPATVVERLARSAAEQPLLVVIDDLHRADPDSVRVLRVLASMLPELPLLLLATSRDRPELDGPAASLIADMTGSWVRRWPLRRLTEREVARALARRAGHAVDREVARIVHRRCGGVPFHVTELARLLPVVDTGPLTEALPEGTRDLVAYRLRRLPDGATEVLTVAAVVGEEFDFELLAEVSDVSADRLLDILEAAALWGLIAETGLVGRYRFSHALVRDTLRHTYSRVRVARLHARVAMAQERRASRGNVSPELLDAVAFHWLAAAPVGHAEQAVTALSAAAGRAESAYAHRHAARLVAAAVRIVDDHAPPGTAEQTGRLFGLLVRWGRLSCRAAQREEAAVALERAIGLARSLGDPEALALAATVHTVETFTATREYGTHDDTVVTALEEALRSLPEEDSPLRCLALAALATERYFDHPPDPAAAGHPGTPTAADAESGVAGPHVDSAQDRLSAEAVAMARRLGDDTLLLQALHLRHQAVRHPRTLAERQELVDEQLDLATRPGVSADWMPTLLLRRALIRLEAGDMPAAQRGIDACALANQRVRLPEVEVHLRWWAAMRRGLAGDLAAAERLAAQAYELHRHTAWGAEPALFAHRVSWLLDEERYEEMEPLVRAAHRTGGPVTPEHLGLVRALQGRRSEARTLCPPAGLRPDPPQDWLWLLQTVLRAYTWALCGDAASCRVALRRLLPYAGRAVTTGSAMLCWGSVDHFLGEVAAVAGERELAIRLMRGAVGHNGELGCTRWQRRSAGRLAELTAER